MVLTSRLENAQNMSALHIDQLFKCEPYTVGVILAESVHLDTVISIFGQATCDDIIYNTAQNVYYRCLLLMLFPMGGCLLNLSNDAVIKAF